MIFTSSDEDATMIVIDRNAIRILELAWLAAFLAELGHERAIITREYLHSMIVGVNDEQDASMNVERQAHGVVNQVVSIALLIGANRELDSSIDVASVESVPHLHTRNQLQDSTASTAR